MAKQTRIIWPGGPHDFVLEEAAVTGNHEDRRMVGWVYVRGCVVEPAGGPWARSQAFLARRTDYGYELMPANRDPIAIWEATKGRG